MILTLLLACWSRAPGEAPLALAMGPVRVFEERVDREAVDLVLVIRAGSAHDPVGQEGLAWLTAQSLVVGSQAGEVPGQTPSLARDLRWEVEPELVRFELRCAREESVACAERLGALVTAPRFNEESLALARARAKVDLREIIGLGQVGEGRRRLALALMDRWLYQGHPYGHPPQGRVASLEVLTLADVQRFHADRYVRGATSLGIAGGPTAEAVVDIQAALSGLPARTHRDATPRALPHPDGRTVLVAEVDGEGGLAVFGSPVDLGEDGTDRLALEAGLSALVDVEGPLARGLKELGADVSALEAALDPAAARVQSAWRLTVPLAAGREQDTVGLVLAALATLVEGGLDPTQLSAFQERARTRLADQSSDPLWVVRAAARSQLLALPGPEEQRQIVDQLGVEDVSAALRRHLDPDNLAVLLLVDEDVGSSLFAEGLPAFRVQAGEGGATAPDPLALRAVHRVRESEIQP